MNKSVETAIEIIAYELERLDKTFTGNINFQLNYREGSVGNINSQLNKSIKVEVRNGV
jgi:hypothetical protein